MSLTGPAGGAIGEVRADLVIGTGTKTERSAKEALEELEREVDRDLEDTADVWGETLSNGISKKLEKSAPEIADHFGAALDKQTIKTKIVVEYDRDNNMVRRIVTSFAENIKDVVQDEGKKVGGGVFSSVGQAISDAIGAGFNISGKSPLIGILIPVFGYIAQLVLGAVQALGGLVALLAIIPGLLVAIGLQAGVLILAFDGVGSAIKGAFAAKNAYELNEAIKELTPAAQQFVKELLPLKDWYETIQPMLQQKFFGEVIYGEGATALVDGLNKIDPVKLGNVAQELGNITRIIMDLFNDKATTDAINTILDSTTLWLEDMKYGIYWLIRGFFALITAAAPFMTWFGERLAEKLTQFGSWLETISENGSLGAFLEEMKTTLGGIWRILMALISVASALWSSLNDAGGADLIGEIAYQLELLAEFLKTDTAKQGFEGMITTARILSQIFMGFIIILFLVFGAIQWLVDKFHEFNFEAKRAGAVVEEVGNQISFAFQFVASMVQFAITAALSHLQYFAAYVSTIPGMIMSALGGLGSQLFDAGASMIQNLVNGMASKIGAVMSVGGYLAGAIASFFVSHSPIKEGPLSGGGDPMLAGENIATRLAEGMEIGSARITNASDNMVSNIIFGPGSIQNNFSGVPTQSQATGIGSGIGNGISSILANRDARLAVRALA